LPIKVPITSHHLENRYYAPPPIAITGNHLTHQKGDNQRDENGYQFKNIGFINDISIFADTPEGMQKLLNVVQEFTAWCGMQINVK